MLFSATMPREIEELSASFMVNPVRVDAPRAGLTADLVSQELYVVRHEDKGNLLEKLLTENTGSVLVFSRTRHGARKVARHVHHLGHASAELHADRTLAQRRAALDGFKRGDHRVLVATDIAARSIDVKQISLVINYDLPDNPEDYIHRIGRTGRAGETGRAITMATPEQVRDVRDIERLIKQEIPLSPHSEHRMERPMQQSRPPFGRPQQHARQNSRPQVGRTFNNGGARRGPQPARSSRW
jgi:ATP-dependent RNA helicase RhlE